MWNSHTETIAPKTSRTRLHEDGAVISFSRVIELLETEADFRNYFTGVIAASPFKAFFWETPSVSQSTIGQPFEFVLVESRSLENLSADSSPFSSHFAQGTGMVLSFPNLGGDAILVVPKPISDTQNYAHLACFLRNASVSQVSEFWQCAASALKQRISSAPVWISTAGLGVSWLHLRLDSRPKYYRHAPYKK